MGRGLSRDTPSRNFSPHEYHYEVITQRKVVFACQCNGELVDEPTIVSAVVFYATIKFLHNICDPIL